MSMITFLIIVAIGSFALLLFSVAEQEKTNPPTTREEFQSTFGGTPWADTFGGPVDWDKH